MKRIGELLWRGAWVILFELGLMPWIKRAARETQDRRWATCLACPIFVKRWGTCGLIKQVDPVTNQVVILGCGCLMRVKKKLKKGATCWARDNGLLLGWPDEINGRDAE